VGGANSFHYFVFLLEPHSAQPFTVSATAIPLESIA
jgi:hypothetical protein